MQYLKQLCFVAATVVTTKLIACKRFDSHISTRDKQLAVWMLIHVYHSRQSHSQGWFLGTGFFYFKL